METGLAGRGVLVTGASGGIGAACARAFAAEGARVVVHYHRGEDRARALAAELGGAPVAPAAMQGDGAMGGGAPSGVPAPPSPSAARPAYTGS